LDRVPDKLPNAASRLIAIATSLLGSPDDVRARMQSSMSDFIAYCEGKKEPPATELDRLLDLIVQEHRALLARYGELLAVLREKRQEIAK
jgi:hypothetical protein